MTTRTKRAFVKAFYLTDKVALITGAAHGIGRGIAELFAEAGAKVVIADLDDPAAQEAASAINSSGYEASSISCDVSSEQSIKQALEFVVSRHGKLDILVNNAGIYPFAPALQMTAAQWDKVQNINLRGLFLLSREFTTQVIKQGGGGVIVNIGSIDSFHPSNVGLAAYDASKGGVLMFTRNFALEVAPHNIRVNMIAPGGITTEGTQKGISGLSREELASLQKEFVARVPLGRWGRPLDIAYAALFLASSASEYMTGSYIIVDGGRLLT